LVARGELPGRKGKDGGHKRRETKRTWEPGNSAIERGVERTIEELKMAEKRRVPREKGKKGRGGKGGGRERVNQMRTGTSKDFHPHFRGRKTRKGKGGGRGGARGDKVLRESFFAKPGDQARGGSKGKKG